MTIAVRYYSRGGNTKKLADAIAAAVGAAPETVETPLKEKADILFLGSALYANGVDSHIETFLKENKDNIGTIYNFSTAALAPSTYKAVKKLTDELGLELSDREFHCKGSFLLLNRGRPNDGDCVRAATFAKVAVEKAGK